MLHAMFYSDSVKTMKLMMLDIDGVYYGCYGSNRWEV